VITVLRGVVLRGVVLRFVTVVCPRPARTEDTIREFDQFLGALRPAARRGLLGLLAAIDQGARLYPRARGRRFARLDDRTADAYLSALLTRSGMVGGMVQRVKGVVVMCYYELAETKREIGYQPGPYIELVSRRRLERYGDEIRAAAAGETQP
jgi:hypothetical protein